MQVFWADDKQWFNGIILSTEVWKGTNGTSKEPRRQVQIKYDDGNVLTHSLHNTTMRTVVLDESIPIVEDVTSNVAPVKDYIFDCGNAFQALALTMGRSSLRSSTASKRQGSTSRPRTVRRWFARSS